VSEPVFSVVIPVRGKWELTRDCLSSLHEHGRGWDYEVLVVDNASRDATATELAPLGEALFGPRFTLLRLAENRNFGPACNLGAERASAPLLFFLNNDTLLTPGFADPLVYALRRDNAPGAIGPLLLYPDQTVQHLGIAFSPNGISHLYKRFPEGHPVVRRTRKLQAITAAALMLPAQTFREAGGFFEGYGNGFEDVDLCLSIRRQGKTLSCVPESVVYHLESRTPGRNDQYQANVALLDERCAGAFHADVHHHALRDGFKVFVNDFFDIGVCLKPEDEAALTARISQAESLPLADWQRLCRENPYWAAGREQLAARLEEEGNLPGALHLRVEIANMLGTEESYIHLSRLAARTGNKDLLALAERHTGQAAAYRTDKRLASIRLRAVLKAANLGGGDLLERLCREKFRAMHP
jgi:GT2 family glycosyltransferase